MTIQEVYNAFYTQCEECQKAIIEVRKAAYSSNRDLEIVRELTIKQAFLRVFTEWEHFLENSVIAFSLDEANIVGYKPVRYIFPIDEDHADRLIKGNSNYPAWSDIKLVKEIANRLFEDGEPYIGAINPINSSFSGMKKVRNVIVHNSVKSKNDFDTYVRNTLGPAKVGITPTDFLLSKKGNNPRYYKLYIDSLQSAATCIVNYQVPEE